MRGQALIVYGPGIAAKEALLPTFEHFGDPLRITDAHCDQSVASTPPAQLVQGHAIYVTSRVLFTLAAKGDAPQWAVALDRRGVPVRAILIGSAFAYAAVIASVLSPERVFAFLVNASGALMLIVYGITALAQIALRKRYDAAGTELPIRMWLFPGLSYATVGIIVVLLAAMTARPQSRLELVSSLICTAIALAAFFLTRRRKP